MEPHLKFDYIGNVLPSTQKCLKDLTIPAVLNAKKKWFSRMFNCFDRVATEIHIIKLGTHIFITSFIIKKGRHIFNDRMN